VPDSTQRPAEPGRVALIRHGETEWSASGRHTSVTDVDLTRHGEVQARTVASLLAGLRLHPATVLVSPRRRARRTATLAGLDEPADRVTVADDLVEWDYGDYEGLTTPQIRQRRPGWELFTDGCPGGESPQQVAERADRLLGRVRDLATGGDLALVCHGHICRVLAVRWVGLPVAAGALVAMDAAAVTVLGHYHGGPIIEHANVVPFATNPEETGR
jgi:probable phosphoglycerate mutase